MDYVTRQFINLAKHFRKDLRKALSDLNGALHKQTEAIRQSYQANQGKQSPPPEVIAIAKFPESVEVHHNAKDTTDEKNYKRVMFLVTSLTLGAIVVYADLVYLQYGEMIFARHQAQSAIEAAIRSANAADTSNTQSKAAARPWIGPAAGSIEDIIFQPAMSQKGAPEMEATYKWRLKNSGGRPARISKIETTHTWFKNCVLHPSYKETTDENLVFGAKGETIKSLVMPTDPSTSIFREPIPWPIWQAVFGRHLRYCVYISIEYVDLIEPNVIHHTRDCALYVPIPGEPRHYEGCPVEYPYAD